MISHTSDYALRAVLVLAGDTTGQPLRAEQIAEATGAPRNYLGKTLNALVKAGVLRSARGPQGGFSLAAPAEKITLARIIDCFVEQRTHTRCLLGNKPCDGSDPCAAHTLWTQIRKSRSEAFATTTIADLIGRPNIEEN
jgi:Rrf2 family transcriptional regulator, iron-sulfur cluster assembly transcription factor